MFLIYVGNLLVFILNEEFLNVNHYLYYVVITFISSRKIKIDVVEILHDVINFFFFYNETINVDK